MNWQACEDDNVIGYSIYAADERCNDEIITRNSSDVTEQACIKLVFVGGYESVFSSSGRQAYGEDEVHTPSFALTPNPFSKLTTISFGVEQSAQSIELKIFDISGRLVKSFNPMPNASGSLQVTWDGCDDAGRAVAAGVYFVTCETGEGEDVEKAILLR
jgi:hypothetical protein